MEYSDGSNTGKVKNITPVGTQAQAMEAQLDPKSKRYSAYRHGDPIPSQGESRAKSKPTYQRQQRSRIKDQEYRRGLQARVGTGT